MDSTQPLLASVLDELQARKGKWPQIARDMAPDAPDSYYSWMTKLAQGRIDNPGVNSIQALADYFNQQRAPA